MKISENTFVYHLGFSFFIGKLFNECKNTKQRCIKIFDYKGVKN